MAKVKRIYKYGTGQPIPEGAKYLATVIQTEIESNKPSRYASESGITEWKKCYLVWHYCVIEVEEK